MLKRHITPFILLLAILPLVYSCSDGGNSAPKYGPYRKNLFNPLYIDQLIFEPNRSGSIWNATNMNQIDIQQISIVLRASKESMDLDKHQYYFDSMGKTIAYKYYSFTKTDQVITQMGFRYKGGVLDKIDYYKYLEMSNMPPIICDVKKKYTGFYTPKSATKSDSLMFYPNPEEAEVIIEKLGRTVNHLEVIINQKASMMDILKRVSRIDTNLTQYENAEKLVTFTENGLPRESFYLDNNWNQMELVKQWEYNKHSQPIYYKEWLHGTQIKDIEIHYNENAMPKQITYNRVKYFLIYRKN